MMTTDIEREAPACIYSEDVKIETTWCDADVIDGYVYSVGHWITVIRDTVCEEHDEKPYGTGSTIEASILAAMKAYTSVREAIDEGR